MALNLPGRLKVQIDPLISDLKARNPAIKWINPRGAHITLDFLGLLNAKQARTVVEVAQSLQGNFGSFNFTTGKISGFPPDANPRVCFLECLQTNGNSASAFQERLRSRLLSAGLLDSVKKWTPHITLGRNKDGNRLRTGKLAAAYEGLEFEIGKFELMESRLSPKGAIYGVIQSFDL